MTKRIGCEWDWVLGLRQVPCGSHGNADNCLIMWHFDEFIKPV